MVTQPLKDRNEKDAGKPKKGRREPTVETVSDWRIRKRVDQATGYIPSTERVLIAYYKCAICGSDIGPDYYEQHMYLYLVENQHIRLWKHSYTVFITGKRIFDVCGTCATHRTLQLSDDLLVLRPEFWLSTILLCAPGTYPERADPNNMKQAIAIRHAIDTYIARRKEALCPTHLPEPHCSPTHLSPIVGDTVQDKEARARFLSSLCNLQ